MPRTYWRTDPGAAPITDPAAPIDKIRKAAIDVHIPLIEEAGKRGVQILGLQEVFNGPYFCPSQDAHWYDIAEPVPGPTTELMAQLREEVPDGDGRAGLRARAGRRLLQHRRGVRHRRARTSGSTARTTSRTRRGSGRSTSSSREPRLPGVPDALREGRRLHLLRPPLPEGARLLGLNGAEIVFNPSATVAGLSQYLWKLEQPAHAVANGYFMACSNRVGTEAPWNIGRFYGSSLLRRSARQLPGDGVGGQGRARRRRDGPRHDRRGPARVAVLPRPPAGQLRRRWRSSCHERCLDQERHDRHRDRSVQGRRLRRGREDHDDRHGADDAGRPRDRRGRQVRAARRHRRPHPPRHAVRRHDVGRRLRVGHDRRRARRHDDRSSTSRFSTKGRRCTTPGKRG